METGVECQAEFHARGLFQVWANLNLSHGPNMCVCRRMPSRMEVVECVCWLMLESRHFVGFCAVSFDQELIQTRKWNVSCDKQVCTLKAADPFGLQILACFMASIVCGVSSRSGKWWNREVKIVGRMIFKHCAKCVQTTRYVCGFLFSALSTSGHVVNTEVLVRM